MLTSGQLGKVPSLNIIIRLQEDLPQSRFSNGIVLQIEFIETMEGIVMGVHIEGIDG